MISLYVPGNSFVHRAPAWLKLLVLVAIGVAASFASPGRSSITLTWLLGGGALLAIACFVVAGLGFRTFLEQIWRLRWLVALTLIPQLFFLGPADAAINTARVMLVVLFAAIVTLTTPMSELLDTLQVVATPLRFVGLRPAQVALLLALTITSIPVIAGFAAELREAQRARGAAVGAHRLVVPLLVRALQHADALGAALRARGLD